MCLDFCSRMNELKRRQILSKPIVLCLNYIYSHIHYRITIKELAEYLSLSESYLSKLFLKEMGIPLSHYITDLKIEKAKICCNIQITALSKSPIISLLLPRAILFRFSRKKLALHLISTE